MSTDDATQRLIAEISGKVDLLVHAMTSGATPATGNPILAQDTPSDAEEILEAVARISDVLDEDPLCQEIVAAALRLSGADRGFLMVFEEGSKLRYKAGVNVTQRAVTSAAFDGSRSIIREAVTGGATVLREAPASATDSMVQHALEAVLCVPIPVGRRLKKNAPSVKVAGIVYLDVRDKALAQRAAAKLERFARHISHALQNSWLYTG